ncbi:unnamed protein product [Linum tenue]|uniref:GTD-binding domain-containing protein n=1 Tax=Linum tenue TaxID=586396 RepID=A0AAV0QV98_9ROSI|nr:unnamed protein product [Linum tenue]
MAANKFATMLHRNTPRITVVLVYAFLEWILIILLLLNSCFSFLISKFASYFGLPPPCLWCSPAISSASSPISHTDLICESHAKEISTLTFCNSHHRLADSQSMCHHCLASAPPRSASPAAPTIAAAFSFISWVAANGDHDETKKKADNCHHQCSCCGEIVAPDLYPPPPYLLLNPLKCGIQDAADDMKGIHLMLMGMEANDDDDGDRGDGEAGANADCFSSLEDGTVEVLKETRNGEQQGEAERQRSCIEMEFVKQNQPSSDDHDRFIEYCFGEDDPLEIMSLHHVHHDSGSGFDSSTSSAYQVGSCKSPGLKQEIQGDEALVDAEEEHKEKIHGEEEEEAARSIEIYASTENNGERSLAVDLAEPTTTGLEEDANTQGWEIHNSEAEQGILLNCGDQQHEAEIEDVEPVGKQEEYSIAQEGVAEDTAVILNDEFEELHTPSSNEVQEESTPLPSQIEEEEESEPASAPEQSHVTSNGLGELLHFNTSVEKNDAPQQSHVNSNGLGELLHCNTSIEKNDAPQQSHVTSNGLGELLQCNTSIEKNDAPQQSQVISNGLGELLHCNTSIEKNDAPQQSHVTSNGLGKLLQCNTSIEKNDAPQQPQVISNGLGELLHFNTSVEKSGEGIGNPDPEKLPDTPNFMDNIQNNLHNKLLMMFEKRDSGAEESFDDGSVVSEIENGDPVLTIERLRTALKSEQNALNALYTELEEERSASAIAANQTMAMINRLQEEKAAMQMEALQYQRMMEEQSEYDQEALQLLNDLMIKREKEKQELERELEVYRKRVLDYEAREKLRMVRRRSEDGSLRSVKSSSTCNNGEDSEELSSIDLNREARDESGSMSENPESSNDHNSYGGGEDENINLEEIAMDCVHHMTALDDSLAEFEDERVSILDQLKVLEEKLLNLGDSNELMNDVNSVRQSLNYSSVSQHGFDDSYDNELSTPEEEDGAKETKHCPERKTMASMAKSLLPLLDAAEEEDDEEEEEGLMNEKKNVEISGMDGDSSSVVSRFGGESKTLAIEDEVDHVYERLQALEADREFLKHCMSSIQKGDKGMDLLQEILQHLRDLRAVEFRVRSMSESPLS